MNLYYQITKTGNLFHFVSNLTDWHYSVRTSYKSYWLEKTGNLSIEESEALVKAKELFIKYSFGQNFWGKVFLRRPEEDVWQIAEQNFGKEDTESFKKITDVFLSKFEKLWIEEDKLLHNWKDELEKSQSKYAPDGLVSKLDVLFNTKVKFDPQVKIILLMCSPTTVGGGGANIGPGAITLEVSQKPFNDIQFVWFNFWHELVHTYWERNREYTDMLIEFVNKKEQDGLPSPIEKVPLKVVVGEAVIESLIPMGYLSNKYFGFNSGKYFREKTLQLRESKVNKSQSLSFWRCFSADKLFSTAKKYVENDKPVDEGYFEMVTQVIKEY